ncbi:Malic enzyme, conserved site-containing protein [Cynara cardunculus var. scolymus]|uniref:Malic enzyme n=1 Tax=Cynara cardunculus var. scolymus TaxID=59895 RepID=A0A103US66_CYNCS|nr:Malic enzyme, conserved site-containing protein [Cynara cardunculus var. scolymus]
MKKEFHLAHFLMLTSSSSFKRINSLRQLLGGLGDRGDKKNLSVMGGNEDDDNPTIDDQPFTPWIVSVASGHMLLRDPHYNKGLAFTEKERDAHYLRGLLPPAVFTQELQEKRTLHILRQYQVPLHRYIAMMDLQERNERLFYKLLVENVEELLPIVYTPTVGEACQKYGSIYRRPQGLYIIIVVTDGERILGLGDLGCQGMGIPVGKLSLYTALGGVRPSVEYDNLLEEFMTAVKNNYGEKVLIQFEDFANHNAFDLLIKYRTSHLVFNDDIQGTACVVLGGLLSALKLLGGTLSDHTFLFLGAGEVSFICSSHFSFGYSTGIAELISLEILKKGLLVSSRKDSLQHFKQPWAHDHEPVTGLLEAVKAIKPTILIGTSGAGKQFTKEVIEAMASINAKPLIMALSNPTSQSECTAEEAYTWSQGHAIFASGSPFDPVTYDGKEFVPGQANNAYIFPGFGLGLIMCGAIRVHDEFLLAASEALASQVTEEDYAKGIIYPRFKNIRKISAHIAAKVWHLISLGLAILLNSQRVACILQTIVVIVNVCFRLNLFDSFFLLALLIRLKVMCIKNRTMLSR